MDLSRLQVRGGVQIQLAKVGYELRQLKNEIERLTLDRPPTDAEWNLITHTKEALKGLRVAQDHAELVAYYLDEIQEESASD